MKLSYPTLWNFYSLINYMVLTLVVGAWFFTLPFIASKKNEILQLFS